MKVKGKVERVGGGRGTRRCYSLYKLGPPARGAPRARDLQSPRVRGTTGPREPRASEIPYGRSPPIKAHVCTCRGDVYVHKHIYTSVCGCVCVHTRANVTYATRVFCNEGRRGGGVFLARIFSRARTSVMRFRLCDNSPLRPAGHRRA